MTSEKFDRAALEQLVTKRFFYAPSFQIYGGRVATGLELALRDSGNLMQF